MIIIWVIMMHIINTLYNINIIQYHIYIMLIYINRISIYNFYFIGLRVFSSSNFSPRSPYWGNLRFSTSKIGILSLDWTVIWQVWMIWNHYHIGSPWCNKMRWSYHVYPHHSWWFWDDHKRPLKVGFFKILFFNNYFLKYH